MSERGSMHSVAILQLDEVSVPQQTPGQTAFAAIVLAGLLSLILLVRYWGSARGLGERLRAGRSAVRESRVEQTPGRVVVRAKRVRTGDADLTSLLRERFADGYDFDADSRTIRGTITTILGQIRNAWQRRLSGLPAPLRRSVRWAVLVAVFGSIATSTAAVQALFETSGPALTPSVVIDGSISSLRTGIDTGIALAGEYPFAGFFWAISLTISLEAAEYLYFNWEALAIALLSVGAGLVAADRYATRRADGHSIDAPDTIVGSPLGALLVSSALALAVLTTGVGVAIAGRRALATATRTLGVSIPPVVAEVAALLASLAVLVAGGWYLSIWLGSVVRYQLSQRGHWSLPALGYWFGRRVLGFLSAVAAVVVVLYAGVAVVEGRLASVLAAFTAADTSIQLAAALAVTAGAVVLLSGARDGLPEIRQAVAEAAAQKALRARLLASGLTWSFVAVSYVIVYEFLGQSIGGWRGIVFAIVGAVALGLVFYLLFSVVSYARLVSDPAALWEERRRPVFITALCYQLEDDDGGYHALIDVNGFEVAAEQECEAIDAAVRAGKRMADADPPPACRESWYADQLTSFGITDADEIDQKLHERVRKAMLNVLREGDGQVTRDEYDRALREYPDSTVRNMERQLAPYVSVAEEWAILERDPFTRRADGRSRQASRAGDLRFD